MADHTVMGLRTAIKSLQDVVAPAVDPANPLANEQLRMVCAYLGLVVQQLPYRSARIRSELLDALHLARVLAPMAQRCSAAAAQALESAIASSASHEMSVDPSECDLERTTARLNASISALVRTASTADASTRREIELAVVADARATLEVNRAWFLPLGFESPHAQIPSISDALASRRPEQRSES